MNKVFKMQTKKEKKSSQDCWNSFVRKSTKKKKRLYEDRDSLMEFHMIVNELYNKT